MVQVFYQDDAGYADWIDRNDRGFVLNINSDQKNKSMIHTSRCSHLYPLSVGLRHTQAKGKACSPEKAALERWANSEGHVLIECPSCNP
jgi:hypothetical protein